MLARCQEHATRSCVRDDCEGLHTREFNGILIMGIKWRLSLARNKADLEIPGSTQEPRDSNCQFWAWEIRADLPLQRWQSKALSLEWNEYCFWWPRSPLSSLHLPFWHILLSAHPNEFSSQQLQQLHPASPQSVLKLRTSINWKLLTSKWWTLGSACLLRIALHAIHGFKRHQASRSREAWLIS